MSDRDTETTPPNPGDSPDFVMDPDPVASEIDRQALIEAGGNGVLPKTSPNTLKNLRDRASWGDEDAIKILADWEKAKAEAVAAGEPVPLPAGHPCETNPFLFRPGDAMNPGGRKRRKTLTESLREAMAEAMPDEIDHLGDGKAIKYVDFVSQTMRKLLIDGLRNGKLGRNEMNLFREIFDRLDPKPRRIEITAGDDDGPSVVYVPGYGPQAQEIDRESREIAATVDVVDQISE